MSDNMPWGTDHQTYAAKCGCAWETGSWAICEAHRKPHSEHTQDSPAPWCPECSIPFVDDDYDDEAETCPRCGEPHVSHQRTPADTYCFQCRYPDVA